MRALRIVAALSAFAVLASITLVTAATAQSLLEVAGRAAHDRGEPGQRWAFTQTITRDNVALSIRFDPSLPEGERWVLLAPVEDALTKEQRSIFRDVAEDQAPDVEVVVGADGEGFDVTDSFGVDVAMLREDAREAVFSFSPRNGVSLSGGGDDGEDQQSVDVAEHLTGEITVTKDGPTQDGPTLQTIHVYATESFKPHPVARVSRLDVIMTFAEIEPGGPLALVSTTNEVVGRALFQPFEESFQVVNSDFARVDGPPAPFEVDAR